MVGTAGLSRPCTFGKEGQSVRWASGPYRGWDFYGRAGWFNGLVPAMTFAELL
jgi:hypothetical protein